MRIEPQLLGYLAGLLTTIAFVPQLVLTLKTRDTRSLSLGMYTAFTLGVALWLAYGIVLHDRALIVANALTLAMALAILCVKIANVLQRRETN